MDIYRKIVIVIIIIVAAYILYRLIQKRQTILKTVEGTIEGTIEGLSSIPNVTSKRVLSIESANTVSLSLQPLTGNPSNEGKALSSFFIKSSCNTAYDGVDVSTDMIIYVLSRGYRFLDFEVYYDISNGTIVGYSNNGAWPSIANPNVLFSNVVETVIQNCFKNPCPNRGDPLFIQIRPMYQLFNENDDDVTKQMKLANNNQLNTQIEMALGKIADYNVNYKGKVSPDTRIETMMGKVVVVMDNTSNSMNKKTEKFVNIINLSPFSKVGTDSSPKLIVNTYGNMDKQQKIEGSLHEILPFDKKSQLMSYNPNVLNMLSTTPTCNISPMMCWMSSYISGISSMGVSELGSYEILFNNAGGTAFIQLAEAQSYANSNNTKINSNAISV